MKAFRKIMANPTDAEIFKAVIPLYVYQRQQGYSKEKAFLNTVQELKFLLQKMFPQSYETSSKD